MLVLEDSEKASLCAAFLAVAIGCLLAVLFWTGPKTVAACSAGWLTALCGGWSLGSVCAFMGLVASIILAACFKPGD